jgi:hypothetical protein
MENTVREDNSASDIDINKKCNCSNTLDPRIRINPLIYYCIEHPNFHNINLEVIESHLLLSKA